MDYISKSKELAGWLIKSNETQMAIVRNVENI
jgi:hypothetical protein